VVTTDGLIFTYRYSTLNTYTVTYNIVNGTWGGGGTTRTETVTHGDMLANIPLTSLATPNPDYDQNLPGAGTWDTTPSGTIEVTASATYTYSYTIQNTYAATVNVNKDDTPWTVSAPTITLRDPSDLSVSIPISTKVVSGTYRIYADGADTGKTVTVTSGGPNSTTLDYYSVTYKAVPAGQPPASTSTISMASAKASVTGWQEVKIWTTTVTPYSIGSSGVVLKGTQLTITATGYGELAGYSYSWTDDFAGSTNVLSDKTKKDLVIEVKNKVEVTCIVTGLVNGSLPVTTASYTVMHYLIDENGVLAAVPYNPFTEELKGLINSTVPATPKTAYEGYTYSPGYPGTVLSGTVKADGSLTLHVYYTKNSWTISYAVIDSDLTTPPVVDPTPPTEYDVPFGDPRSVALGLDYTDPSGKAYVFKIWGSPHCSVNTGGNFNMPDNNVVFYGSWILLEDPAGDPVEKANYIVNHYTVTGGVATLRDTETYAGKVGDTIYVGGLGDPPGANIVLPKNKAVYAGYEYQSGYNSTPTSAVIISNSGPGGGVMELNLYYTEIEYNITYEVVAPPPGAPPEPGVFLFGVVPTVGDIVYTETAPFGEAKTVKSTDPFQFGGYTFGGWVTQDVMVNFDGYFVPTKDVLFVGTWYKSIFTVTFVDPDGNIIGTDLVGYGSDAKAPTAPTRSGQNFNGWLGDYTNVMDDLTVTANYSTPIDPYTPTPAPVQPTRPPTQNPGEMNPGENDEYTEDPEDDVPDNTGGAGGGAGGGGGGGGEGSDFIDDTGEPTGTRGAHAIINLLLMLLTVLTAAATIMAYFNRRTFIEIDKTKQEEYNYEYGYEYEEEYNARVKKYPLFRIIGLGCGLAALVVFLVTQDLTGEMMFADQYTPFHLAAFVVSVLMSAMSLKKYIAEDEELYDEAI